MKGVKSMCSFTKSVFGKSSSSTPSKRVFSAKSQSENQQPLTPADDIDEDLVGPFLYPSNLGSRGNAFKKKTEEEDDDDSEESQEEEDGTDDIPTEKDGGIHSYGLGFYQHFGPFRGSPIHLPKHPISGYISGGPTVGKGKGPYGDGNEHQGQSSNHGGVCNGCPGSAVCSWCGCSQCKGCSGGYSNCPGCGRSGGNYHG